MKKLPPPFQGYAGRGELPRTTRETYAAALKEAELEFRQAQDAFNAIDSDESRARYAKALFDLDRLRGAFPLVAAGLGGDAQA